MKTRSLLVVWLSCSSVIATAATPVAKKVPAASAGIELLANGGFEGLDGRKPEAWSWYEQGGEVDRDAHHGGQMSVRCDNSAGKLGMGFSQSLNLDRREPRLLIASGWSRAENVVGTPNADYSIYVDIIYQDGTPLWGRVASFSCGTHDWEYRQVRIVPDKPVRQISVHALFRGRKGRVWFDDVSLKEAVTTGPSFVFDGVGVQPAGEARSPAADATGEIHLRDVAADGDFFRVREAGDSDATVQIPELQLAVTSKTAAVPGGRRIDMTVKDLAGRDRAVALYYVVPIKAAGWHWYDNVRESQVIKPSAAYQNVTHTGVGTTGQTSRYPFACVAGPHQARSLLVNQPCLCRFGYAGPAGELYAAFDIGLVKETKTPGQASVSVVDVQTDPTWGMRATAQRFYELLPAWFDPARVPRRQGNWMAFTAISSVQKPEDFGFAVHEGDNDVRWDNDHGVQAYVYVEPMTWWLPMPKEMPRTYAAALAHARSFQRDPRSDRYAVSWAVEQSAVADEDGRLHLDVLDTPWVDGAVFGNSADPDVPEKDGHLNLARLNLRTLEDALRRAEAQGGLAGVYLDSLEGWGMLRNQRREHFAAADLPLTFDSSSHRPVILNAMATQEWTEHIAGWIRSRGKLLMANAVPHNFPFLALPLDLMGTETNFQHDGKFAPPGPDFFYLKRTLAWHRPYMFLMNTRFETWTREMTERYMQLCLFYGMFPGFFSENASTNCYFANPTWYNRDRELFQRYMPVIRRVAQAGWEPVTHAAASNEAVWVERWGREPSKGLYFTLMNTTETEQQCRLSINLKEAAGCRAVSLLNGEAIGEVSTGRLKLAAHAVDALVLESKQER
ncbi:MAG TPA: hypothetical protein PKY77_09775 [Phycisphaerae bacterium]|nr:hypothetical protein [Phycisphaerae bacterium]HRY68154.1 hypothetical protein [Phycisphaerae bacterium]HSA27050.1 hypothetical protein [Phycisphaerae bacterium]